MAADSEFTPVVRRLACLRGISTLTAFALAVEIGDWHRFTGDSIGAYVGLVPSEHSSGATRVAGADHQDRQRHVRRLLVEAAWHHRSPLPARRGAAPPLGPGPARGPGPRRTPATGGCTSRWVGFTDAASGP